MQSDSRMYHPLSELSLNTFISATFAWFAGGLSVTFITAFALYITGIGYILAYGPILLILSIIQLATVFGLGFFINKMSATVAGILFLAYSFLTGLTFSGIFLAYGLPTVLSTFVIAAGMFGIVAAYGYTTKQNLSLFGRIAFMGLFGLILASIVNIFFASSGLEWIVNYAGVAIFLVLTAWDMQKLKLMAQQFGGLSTETHKFAIYGALQLYLDFINLFIFILRIFGGRRD